MYNKRFNLINTKINNKSKTLTKPRRAWVREAREDEIPNETGDAEVGKGIFGFDERNRQDKGTPGVVIVKRKHQRFTS